MCKYKKQILLLAFILLAVAGILICFIIKNSDSKEEKLLKSFVEYIVTPQSYKPFETVEGGEQFFSKLKNEYKCVSLRNSKDLAIGTYIRYYYTAIEKLKINGCKIESIKLTETEPPKYKEYAPSPNYICDVKYIYSDDKGTSYALTDKYYISFLDGNVVYFKADNETLIETGIMSLTKFYTEHDI